MRTDRISADLAAGRLRREGIPAEVVSDDDRAMGIAMAGTPMSFSLVVPSQYEDQARRILETVAAAPQKQRRSRSRDEARQRRR